MSPGAENEQGDSSLVESSNLRAVRAAEPAPGKCNDKNCQRKKRRNKKKGNKNSKRARNNRKRGNKKSRKSNKKSKKSNKVSKKSKKMSKKSNKRNKKRKGSRNQKVGQGAGHKRTGESKCSTPKTCIATAIGYMKKNDMVRNFEAQKKRLERFVKQANSKSKKSADFEPLIVKLTALGGGNSSNLLCNGNATNAGAVLLKNLNA